MSEHITCKECEYFTGLRSPDAARKYGQMYECQIHILSCPKPTDFCSKAKREEPKKLKPIVKGKWEEHMDCEGKTRWCICNQCGYETHHYCWSNPNFCANCGADMRGEDT